MNLRELGWEQALIFASGLPQSPINWSPCLDRTRRPQAVASRTSEALRLAPDDDPHPPAASYTHLRAHETNASFASRILLDKNNNHMLTYA